MKTNLTPVIFRTFLNSGGVIALFPHDPYDNAGYYCSSYMHVGQHSAADPSICRRPYTRPSTPAEICELACELRGLGYALKGMSRMPANALAVRRRVIAAMDGGKRGVA